MAGFDPASPVPTQHGPGGLNATLALLDRHELVDYGAPFGSQPGRPEQSPIWLTVVGHEALWPLKAQVGYHDLLREENRAAEDERGPYTYVNPELPTAAALLYQLEAPRHFQLVGLLVTMGLLAHVWVWGRRYAEWRQIGAVSGWEWSCLWAPAVVLLLLVFLLGWVWWWAAPWRLP